MLLQMIDVSDKMLYNEVKAEKDFGTLINAAVSHELRNPLNSLIGQITSMDTLFEFFLAVITEMPLTSDLRSKLSQIYDGLSLCSNKITSAAKFIDFFVHDILDYTVLNKDAKNFVKQNSIFDI